MKVPYSRVTPCPLTEMPPRRREQEGQGYLEELVKDMVAWLSLSSGQKPERSLQSNGLITTLSQHYFLFLGTLSANPHGVKLLEKCGLFQW